MTADKNKSILLEQWTQVVATTPDDIAIWCGKSRTTYSFTALAEMIEALEHRLPNHLYDQTVAIHLTDSIDWLAAFMAFRIRRCCLLPLDGTIRKSAMEALLARTGCEAIYTDSGLQINHSPASSSYPGAALLKLTSGTTGSAKPIPFTESELIADTNNICQTMGISRKDRNFSLLPLAHSYALGNLVIPLFSHGIPLCLGSSQLPSAIAEELAWNQSTVFPSVPQIWSVLTRSGVNQLAHLRLAISAAAPLTVELAAAFHDRFSLRLHNFYGASETGGIAYDRSGECGFCGDKLGSALDGVSLTVNTNGNLCVESEAVSRAIGTATADGRKQWVMADRAMIDECGMVTLQGRCDRVIKHHGRRYDLDTMETDLRTLLKTEEIALVYHQGNARFGLFVPHGFRETAKDTLENELPMIAQRVRVIERETLPRNARGKIDLNRLTAEV